MKKFISLLLALVLACTIATPAFAAAYSAEELNVPIVTIRGDGTDIYDASGENIVWPVSLGDEEGDSEILKDSVIEVLSKLLVDAALFGDYSTKEIKRLQPKVQKVLSYEEEYKALSDAEL